MWSVHIIPHGLITSVGKTTTTLNATQGPSRGFHDIHQGENVFNSPTGAAKSTSYTAIAAAMQSVHDVLHEISTTHETFCTQWGVSQKGLEETPESTATTAYGAYMLDIGLQGDTVKLNMALAACLLGYGEVGLWLADESKRHSW